MGRCMGSATGMPHGYSKALPGMQEMELQSYNCFLFPLGLPCEGAKADRPGSAALPSFSPDRKGTKGRTNR